jgi:hypothetical protein
MAKRTPAVCMRVGTPCRTTHDSHGHQRDDVGEKDDHVEEMRTDAMHSVANEHPPPRERASLECDEDEGGTPWEYH